MSVLRTTLTFAGILVGAAALAQLVRQPVARLRREGENRDRVLRIADEDAASPIRSDLKLEAVGGRHPRPGEGWFVAFTFGHPDNSPRYAGRWNGPDPFTFNLPETDHV